MKGLIIFFIYLISSNYAQVLIKGRILDAEDLSPLYLANVTIEGKNLGTVTDKEGQFELIGDIHSSEC